MTDCNVDPEHFPWILLLGAILANKEARDEAFRVITPDEVPESWRGIWNAVRNQKGSDVWSELHAKGIEKRGEKVLSCIIQNLQERLLARFCKETVTRVEFSKGLNAEELATRLEMMSSKIRARQAEIEKNNLPKPASGV